MVVEDAFIESPNGRIHYRYSGRGCGKTPLLVLHGGPGASCDYLVNIEKLSDERPVILYDQLGSGDSDRNPDKSLWSADYFVKELDFVRTSLGLEGNLYILGQSWGAMLAILYMLDSNPRGIKGLVLAAPCLSAALFEADQRKHLSELPREIEETILACESRQDYMSDAYQSAMNIFYKRFLCMLDPWPESLLSTFRKMNPEIYAHMWGPSEFTVSGTLKGLDRCSELKKISIPVLLTCGRFDEAAPETLAFYKSCFPNAEMAIFEDASHSHHIEKEAEFLERLRNFLFRGD